jgi:hypothetical protein
MVRSPTDCVLAEFAGQVFREALESLFRTFDGAVFVSQKITCRSGRENHA